MQPVIIQIPKQLLAPAEQMSFEGDVSIDKLVVGPDEYIFPEKLKWQIDATNTGGAILVQGTVEGAAVASCARCLEDTQFQVIGEIEGYYLIPGEDGLEDTEDLEEDELMVLPDDKRIDLAPLIEAALVLEMPIVPLCDDNCKGLCAKCGTNLNESDCDCASNAEQILNPSNPFSALANLKFDNDDQDSEN